MSALRTPSLFARAFARTAARRLRHGPRRPGWSFRLETLFEFLRLDWDELATWPVERVRADMEGRPVPQGVVGAMKRDDARVGGVAGVWFTPEGASPGRVLLYLHGGSYLMGSPVTHADLVARHALASGSRAFAPAYRLAPEHPYPAQLEDALAVYEALLAQGTTPSRLAVAGESAGGNLTLSLLLELKKRSLPLPSCAVVISPWLDLSAGSASCEGAGDDYGSRAMLLSHAALFAGGVALDDPRVSPLFADLAGLPPLLVQVGTAERLLDECRELSRRARASGVEVTLDELAEMPHAAQIFAQWCDEGARAIERAGRFIAGHTG